MSYFTMPDAIAFSSLIMGGVLTGTGLFYKFKSNNNGNTKRDLDRITEDINKKQDIGMCNQKYKTVDEKYNKLELWINEISIQNKKLSEDMGQVKTNVALIKQGIEILKERRDKKR